MRIIALFLLSILLVGCSSLNDQPINSFDAYEFTRYGKTLIDVRLEEERHDGTPEPAVVIPYRRAVEDGNDATFVAQVKEIASEGGLVMLICRVGVRSRWARDVLRAHGFYNVESVVDGYAGNESGPGWKGWGFPTK